MAPNTSHTYSHKHGLRDHPGELTRPCPPAPRSWRVSRTNWASLYREQWRPQAAPRSRRHGGGTLPVVSQRQGFREPRHARKLSRQPHNSSRRIRGFRPTHPPPSRSRGQEKNGAPTIAQQAHAVTDELILAAVHATGRPLRGPSCHSTGAPAHGPAQTKSQPRLLRFIQGRGDDREAGDVSTAPTPQRTNELAKSRGATTPVTRPILACGSAQSGQPPRPRTLARRPLKNSRPVDLWTLKRHRLSN